MKLIVSLQRPLDAVAEPTGTDIPLGNAQAPRNDQSGTFNPWITSFPKHNSQHSHFRKAAAIPHLGEGREYESVTHLSQAVAEQANE